MRWSTAFWEPGAWSLSSEVLPVTLEASREQSKTPPPQGWREKVPFLKNTLRNLVPGLEFYKSQEEPLLLDTRSKQAFKLKAWLAS